MQTFVNSDFYVPFILMAILFLGFLSQWLAWRLKLPAILFLILCGLVIGPLSVHFNYSGIQLFDPEHYFEDLLYPMVSVCVAIILFEGCLCLKFSEVRGYGVVVRRLITTGMLITGLLSTLLCYFVLGVSLEVACLVGAITVVSGPTVVPPLLRTVRPTERVSNILRWEAMLIDPLGALLAVFVFIAISTTYDAAFYEIILQLFEVLLVGGLGGLLLGYMLGIVLRRQYVPSYLTNMFVLTVVIFAYVFAEQIAHGAGLLIVTIMGLVVANMPDTHIDDVLDFKENLSLLLISGLFIILGATINFGYLHDLWWRVLILILLLQFIVRPLVVYTSTFRTGIPWREKVILGWIYPRGIIAASVAALFAIKLEALTGIYQESDELVLIVFMVILGTVIFQSMTAPIISRLLKVSAPEPEGFLIIGGDSVSRYIAKVLMTNHIRVTLTDTTWRNYQACRLDGLHCYFGNPVSKHADWHLNLLGLGRMLGLSTSIHMNTLAAVRFAREFGKGNIYLLNDSSAKKNATNSYLTERHSRILFNQNIDYATLENFVAEQVPIKTTLITENFDWQAYSKVNPSAIPLFFISPKGKVVVSSPATMESAPHGWRVMAFIPHG